MSATAATSLRIDLGERGYPILIGTGLLDDTGVLAQHVTAHDVLVVTNTTVGPLYLDRLRESLAGKRVGAVVLPDGERHKTLAVLAQVFDALVEARLNRDACIVALGGGVVGDMAGFAAACYQRGVDFVQVPTTLLAQVDSSVGGKTGVNHPGGKNLIGAFHQPRAVLADTATLATLPARELRAGLAEVIKYGLVDDADFLGWLESHVERLLALDLDGARARHPPLLRDQGRASSRRTSASTAGVRCSTSATRSATRSRRLRATATGCTARRSRSACWSRRTCRRQLGWLGAADVERVRELLRRARPADAGAGDRRRARPRAHGHRQEGAAPVASASCCSRGLGKGTVSGDYPAAALQATLASHFRAVRMNRAYEDDEARLAPYARTTRDSRGRRVPEPPPRIARSSSATATASCTRPRSAASSTRRRCS